MYCQVDSCSLLTSIASSAPLANPDAVYRLGTSAAGSCRAIDTGYLRADYPMSPETPIF